MALCSAACASEAEKVTAVAGWRHCPLAVVVLKEEVNPQFGFRGTTVWHCEGLGRIKVLAIFSFSSSRHSLSVLLVTVILSCC